MSLKLPVFPTLLIGASLCSIVGCSSQDPVDGLIDDLKEKMGEAVDVSFKMSREEAMSKPEFMELIGEIDELDKKLTEREGTMTPEQKSEILKIRQVAQETIEDRWGKK